MLLYNELIIVILSHGALLSDQKTQHTLPLKDSDKAKVNGEHAAIDL